MTELMNWQAGRRRWSCMQNYRRFTISCKALGVPPNREESREAANAWFTRKLKEEAPDSPVLGKADLCYELQIHREQGWVRLCSFDGLQEAQEQAGITAKAGDGRNYSCVRIIRRETGKRAQEVSPRFVVHTPAQRALGAFLAACVSGEFRSMLNQGKPA